MDKEYVDLYPLEYAEAKSLAAAIQRKWGTKLATQENMRFFVEEVTDRFASELGLVVTVDEANLEPIGDGDEFVVSPILEITGRVDKKETFDFARAQFEVQAGFADLKPGIITEKGEWREPNKKM